MSTSPWQLLAGQVIDGTYHLTDFVGAGSFGGVFKADQVVGNRLMRTVAIKVISPPTGGTPEQIDARHDKQLQELQFNAQLDHPFIVRCFSVGECELQGVEYLYLALELGEQTLESRLMRGPLSAPETRAMAGQLVQALAYLHDYRGCLVHRDIKPANVLLVGGVWKLSDLGTARGLADAEMARSQAIGTANYAPPESYDGEISPAWDIWSLGVMLIEALTGALPFSAETASGLMKQVLTTAPDIPADLPDPFGQIVRGCLERDRQARLTARQLLSLLEDTTAATGPLNIPATPFTSGSRTGQQPAPAHQSEPPPPVPAPPPPAAETEPAEILRTAVREAFSDQILSDAERRDINQLRKQLGIDLDTTVAIFIEEKQRALRASEPEPEPKPTKPKSAVRKPTAPKPTAPRPAAQPQPKPAAQTKPPPAKQPGQAAAKPPAAKPAPARRSTFIPAIERKPQSFHPVPPTLKRPVDTTPVEDIPDALIVSQQALHQPDYTSLGPAVKAAQPGQRIVVHGGVYREALVLEQPVSIERYAQSDEVVIESTDRHGVLMLADRAILKGLTIHCRSARSTSRLAAVFIARGQLGLELCQLSSLSYAVLLAAGAAAQPALSSCLLSGSASLGAGFIDGAGGTLVDCDIRGMDTAGVFIGNGAAPSLCKCVISGNKHYGVMVFRDGRAQMDQCTITSNLLAGVEVRDGGTIRLKDCRITNNGQHAITADPQSSGRVENCDLRGNRRGAWDLALDSNIIRIGNRD